MVFFIAVLQPRRLTCLGRVMVVVVAVRGGPGGLLRRLRRLARQALGARCRVGGKSSSSDRTSTRSSSRSDTPATSPVAADGLTLQGGGDEVLGRDSGRCVAGLSPVAEGTGLTRRLLTWHLPGWWCAGARWHQDLSSSWRLSGAGDWPWLIARGEHRTEPWPGVTAKAMQ